MQAVGRRLDDGGFVLVCKQPVQLRGGIALAERRTDQVECIQPHPRLADRGAPAEDPWDQLKLRYVFLSLPYLGILRIADEVQPGHTEPGFIDGVVVQRIPVRDVRHADHGVMRIQPPHVAERKRIAARRDRHTLAVGAFIVQRPAEIKVLCLKSCCSTHGSGSFLKSFSPTIPHPAAKIHRHIFCPQLHSRNRNGCAVSPVRQMVTVRSVLFPSSGRTPASNACQTASRNAGGCSSVAPA